MRLNLLCSFIRLEANPTEPFAGSVGLSFEQGLAQYAEMVKSESNGTSWKNFLTIRRGSHVEADFKCSSTQKIDSPKKHRK